MGGPQQHASRTQGEQRRRGDGGRHAEGPPHPRDPARSTESVSDEDPETGGRTKFRTPARTTISFAVRRRGRSVPLRRTLRRRGRSVHHRRRRGRTLRRRGRTPQRRGGIAHGVGTIPRVGRIPRVRRHLPGGGPAAYGSSNPVSVEGSGGRVWPRVRLLADRHDVMESIRVLTPERVGVHDLPLPARPHSARHAARPQLLGPSGGPILPPPPRRSGSASPGRRSPPGSPVRRAPSGTSSSGGPNQSRGIRTTFPDSSREIPLRIFDPRPPSRLLPPVDTRFAALFTQARPSCPLAAVFYSLLRANLSQFVKNVDQKHRHGRVPDGGRGGRDAEAQSADGPQLD